MYKITSTTFVALSLAVVVPAANGQLLPTENLIPQWLPQCFDGQQAVNPLDAIDCIRVNSQPSCMEKNFQETVRDVVQCVNISISDEVIDFFESFGGDNEGELTAASKQGGDSDSNPFTDFLQDVIGVDTEGLFNLATVFVNATLDCLDPYVDCVNQTIHQAMNTELEPCINQTLRDLVDCGRDNSETCMETCNSTQLLEPSTTTPFEGLNFMSVQTCQGIQTNIMDPLCSVVSCCEPCVSKTEALIQCIVNQQLDQVPAVGVTCEALVCPAASQRQLRHAPDSNKNKNSRLLQENPTQEDCLQYSPGLTGDDGEELSARSSVFLPCVSNSFLGAVQTTAAEESMAAATGEMKDNDTPSGGNRLVAGSAGLVAMMAVATFAV